MPIATKKKTYRQVAKGRIYILATFNNTLATVTDIAGNVLSWSSAGNSGFKGTKKATPFAATQATRTAIEKAKPFGLTELAVFVSGVGTGRDASLRAIAGTGLNITSIKDVTPIPHNGPRAKKPRRV